jgi:DDE superfamily endonuclease
VVCCEEKPSIQTRARKHPSQPAKPDGDGQLVEHEYERKGALCYLAAWDVRHARLFDRCAPKDGIKPFDQLIEQLMTQDPYGKAQRMFVVVDNGSAHRGQRSIASRAPGQTCVSCTPRVHASCLNQAEIYFSVAQRKVLQPNNFPDLDTLERKLLAFGRH